MERKPERRRGVRGILADISRLDVWLDVVLVVLTLASAARYVDGHGFGDRAPAVLGGATVLLACYAARPRSGRWTPGPWPWIWCLTLVAIWFVLVVLAPSFAWLAVPLSFVVLRVLPFAAAGAVIAFMTACVVVAWTLMQGDVDLTVVTGPISVAWLAVVAYRALEREAASRQDLLNELQEAQGNLAEAQHRAGVLAERARLSREIHDSVAQALSSINLLLQAAERSWTSRPDAARDHVAQAASTARDGLDEVRRVVRNLAPPELGATGSPPALVATLRRTCERAVRGTGVRADVHVDGIPVDVPVEVATALLRTARGALANVVEHAAARTATVSLTYQPDLVSLDVRDDGSGFDPRRATAAGPRGRGLPGIRDRAEQFGGTLTVETAPGEGTALAFTIPLGSPDGRH
ncbi:sensor histidine kinase [Blastococcus sp. CT_GayMR19]|uniref:sensor histidine kinase n=1 Tax=Blastococcus sp. CT_GayMR19 TaxID=2559608 RepID=UPI001073C64F|nr:sensor histidine kinase [Blastococcus sp. CT_GayMR19]TFV77531.1 sensor histidine kinase [Blastococcus sp. CT_GayMR19]